MELYVQNGLLHFCGYSYSIEYIHFAILLIVGILILLSLHRLKRLLLKLHSQKKTEQQPSHITLNPSDPSSEDLPSRKNVSKGRKTMSTSKSPKFTNSPKAIAKEIGYWKLFYIGTLFSLIFKSCFGVWKKIKYRFETDEDNEEENQIPATEENEA